MEQRIGCGDNSCIFSDAISDKGMGTNGGCRCFQDLEFWIEKEQRWNRKEINYLRRSVMIQQRMYRDKIKALEDGSEIKRLVEENKVFKHKILELQQISGILCDNCGWAMKFPDEPCRCELEDKLNKLQKRFESLSKQFDDNWYECHDGSENACCKNHD
jgi:hypothetical protein